MEKINEVIVVEGRYDKNALSQVVDAVIIETGGFGIFNDTQKQKLLRKMAEERGLIVLTDSDGAGFLIRSRIKSAIDPRLVKHAYIPDIPGKERRKAHPSREGTLGVEGMTPELLQSVLLRAGATTGGERQGARITKADLFAAGLSGTPGSAGRRKALLRKLSLPEKLSPNALLDVLNSLMSREEFLTAASVLEESPSDT